MGLYISNSDVQVRLQGKVRFTDDTDDANKTSTELLNRLVAEAEGQVERDLSPRYFAPFQTDECHPFKNLPDRPTRNILRTLCELQAVMRVLETDFGKGSAMNGEAYSKKLEERYKSIIDKELEKKDKDVYAGPSGWKYPPLPGLKLNYFNTHADDGYAGMVLNTTRGVGGFPSVQINDPRESFVNGAFDHLDGPEGGVFDGQFGC